MNIIIFPGNSKRNKEWADAAEQAFVGVDGVGKIYKQYYKHWETGESNINFETELEVFAQNAPQGEPYVVIAKSAGSLLTMLGVSKRIINPVKVVFCGVPISSKDKNDDFVFFGVDQFSSPGLVFQNDRDPIATFKQVKEVFEGKDTIKVIERIADNHDYLDFSDVKEEIIQFIL